MSLRRFLVSAYSLLVEAWQSVGVDMLTAVGRVNESIGLMPAVAVADAPPPKPSAADNERALQQLNEMMRGVKRR